MSNVSKYKQRLTMRLRGHAPTPRDPPKFAAEFNADFMLRDKEQAEAARKGPLSKDPNVAWGNQRLTRAEQYAQEQLAEKAEKFDRPRLGKAEQAMRERSAAFAGEMDPTLADE